MSEIDKFFEGLPSEDRREADIFNEKPEADLAKGTEPPVEGEGSVEERKKNRRERRREDREKSKDDMLVALNDRIIELSKPKNSDKEFKPSSEVPSEWIALYGDTPEARKAWDVNLVLLNRAKQEAKEEAISEFKNEQESAAKEQKKFESFIDNSLEDLEDDFGVDLTSDAPAARKARREFLEMIQDLSPKDDAGTIIGYADFEKTFKLYQDSRKQDKNSSTDKRKELAARSMTKGSNSPSLDQNNQDGPITWDTAKKAIRGLL
jgi:hypothetical protein